MFKKPLAEFKTSAPLRTSDRKKLRQRVTQEFSLSPEVGELLIPEGLLSVKYTSHSRVPGVVYLSSDGVPLWFTTGKGSDHLIPTLYTLWKHADLLPPLSTPSAVIPVLVNGADLMAPGVVQHSPSLSVGQLVCVTQYYPAVNGAPQIGPALAVGHMALTGDQIGVSGKGKAVNIIHTWKDHLWEMGRKEDPPPPRVVELDQKTNPEVGGDNSPSSDPGTFAETKSESPGEETSKPQDVPLAMPPKEETNPLSQQEVSDILRSALLQSVATKLSKLPSSSFPISPSVFSETYILPYRSFKEVSATSTPVDIKHSGHKSLTAFLKASAKEGLIRVKEIKGEVAVIGVNQLHPSVDGHPNHVTVKDVEEKVERKEERERQEERKAKEKGRELQVTLLWKPHMGNVPFFKEAGRDPGDLFTQVEIRSIVNGYVAAKQILNPKDQAYVNVTEDPVLLGALSDLKATERKQLQETRFLRRNEVSDKIIKNMQPWYEITGEGKDPVVKKGELKQVSVIVKARQGRRATTCVTGFENFQVEVNDLAEELRKACASSTSVNPLPGKTAGQELMIQGKQLKAVTDLLIAKGVPKQWIDAKDTMTGKK